MRELAFKLIYETEMQKQLDANQLEIFFEINIIQEDGMKEFKIYNTLTKKVEDFKPNDDKEVKKRHKIIHYGKFSNYCWAMLS